MATTENRSPQNHRIKGSSLLVHPDLAPLLAAIPVNDFDAVPIEDLRALSKMPTPNNPELADHD